MNVKIVKAGNKVALTAYGVSLAAVTVAVAARLLLEPLLADRLPFTTLFLALGFATWFGGRAPGMLALVAGAIAAVFFIFEPRFSFAIDKFEDQVGLVLYGVVGGASIAMFESLRKAHRQADEQRRQLQLEIAAHRNTEQAFAEQAKRLRRMFESNVVGMIRWDLDRSLILEANDTFLKMSGYTRDDVSSGRLNFRDMTPPDWTLRNEQGIRSILADGYASPYEKEYFRKDGSRLPLIIAGTRFEDSPSEGMSILIDISDSKRAEQEIARIAAASERQRRLYETVMTNTPDFMYVFSLDHKVIYANEALIKMWGRGRDGAIGKTFLEIGYEPWHAEMHNREIDQVRITRQPIRGEVPFNGTDGKRHYDYIFVPVLGPDGEVEAVAGTTRDITERKETERKLRDRQEQLDFALAAADLGQWSLNLADRTARRTLRHDQLFGYDALLPEWTYEMFLQHVVADDRAAVDADFQKSLSTGSPWAVECRIRRVDGPLRHIWIKALIRRDDDGQIEWMLGIVGDVTDRRQAEEAERTGRERLRMALSAARMVAWEYDPATGAVVTSDNAKDVYGFPSGEGMESIGSAFAILHPEDVDRHRSTVEAAVEAGEGFTSQFRIVRPDTEAVQWMEERGHAIRDGAGTTVRLVGVNMDITDRRRAELELVESKRKLDLAMQVSGIVAWSFDVETQTVIGGATLNKLFGFEGDTPPPLDQFVDRMHPDDRDRVSHAIANSIENGAVYDQEYRVKLPNGMQRWLRGFGQTFARENHSSVEFAGILYDITSRKEHEVELADREAHLRRVINNQLGLVGVIDRNEILLEVDDRSLAIAKARREDVIGKHFADAPWWNYDPEVAQQMRVAMRKALAGDVVRYDVSLFAHGEEGVMIDFMIAPVFGEDGEVEFLIPSGVDIRERHAAEVAIRESERLIRESEEKFRVMADGLPSLIWVHDAAGNLLFVNQAYRDFYRLADGEILGDRWQNLVHPDDYDGYTAQFVNATEKRSLFHAEARVRSDNGEWRWVESWGQPRFSDEGEFLGYVGNSIDVTTRKANEALLEQALVDLELARKLAQDASQSKSEFLANMSHEIRTPMTAILGYAELLNALNLPSEAHDYLKTIRRNGDYLLEIINDILDLSKIEAGKLELNHEQFDPAQVVEDVRSIMNVRAIENGLQFNVRYEGKLPRQIKSDPKRLKQILINLVGNAIKFTKKGQVDIVVTYQAGSVGPMALEHDSHCIAELDSKMNRLMFDIIDTGIGMSDDQQTKLFKPFSQGDSSVSRHFGGTGLGLAISRRLAEMLGGNIRAESKLGEGSKFSVTIGTGHVNSVESVEPSEFIETPTPAITTVADESLLGCRILVVDDRRDIRYLSRRILSSAGASVEEAEDGQFALDFVRDGLAASNPPNLILLDMQMPNLDGYETAARLREIGFIGPIIALTADAMQGDMNRCIEAGCNEYLSNRSTQSD